MPDTVKPLGRHERTAARRSGGGVRTVRSSEIPIAAFMLTAAVSGCTVGPDQATGCTHNHALYQPGESRALDADAGTAVPMQTVVLGDKVAGDWWTLFRSPELDALVKQAIADSPTLETAKPGSPRRGTPSRQRARSIRRWASAQTPHVRSKAPRRSVCPDQSHFRPTTTCSRSARRPAMRSTYSGACDVGSRSGRVGRRSARSTRRGLSDADRRDVAGRSMWPGSAPNRKPSTIPSKSIART